MTIKIKYTNSNYGYQGHDGFALIINGVKMHDGLFNRVLDVRQYWNKYRYLLCAGIVPKGY